MPRSDFAAFILTHGRANNVFTYKTLRESGYTGNIYLIIDNEDEQADQYRERYGDKVIQFDKDAEAKLFDTADLSEDRRTIVYARNACHRIAKELGLTYYLQLDDDYTRFSTRYPLGGKLRDPSTRSLDKVCDWYIEFLEDTGALTVAFAQGGDYLGGIESDMVQAGYKRKAMNSFFVRTSDPVNFVGRVNEDVNTYVSRGNRGDLFFTHSGFYLTQQQTQKNAGGMTSTYLDGGTYLKSFYTVLYCPSAVTIRLMGETHRRMHHSINWRRAVPQIISDSWRKPRPDRHA